MVEERTFGSGKDFVSCRFKLPLQNRRQLIAARCTWQWIVMYVVF